MDITGLIVILIVVFLVLIFRQTPLNTALLTLVAIVLSFLLLNLVMGGSWRFFDFPRVR